MSTDPKSAIIGISDSQGVQGPVNGLFSDGEKPSTQVTEDRSVSVKRKKRSRRNANKDKAQLQGSPSPVAAPDILPLDYCGPMPAPITSRRGLPITSPSPEPSIAISPSLAFAEPTKAEETLRQENERLRLELEEANCLAKGLKKVHLQLEEEVEAWKQKCEGFSEAVEKLRSEVEGMIDSRISKFLDKMEKKKEEEGKEKEWKEGRERLKGKKEEEERGKEKERKEKERKEKGGNEKKGKKEVEKTKGWKDMDGKVGGGRGKEAELKARQEKNRQSSLEQIQAYRQRKKQEERRRKKWWTRFQIKPVRNSHPFSQKNSSISKLCFNYFSKKKKKKKKILTQES